MNFSKIINNEMFTFERTDCKVRKPRGFLAVFAIPENAEAPAIKKAFTTPCVEFWNAHTLHFSPLGPALGHD